jgi:hypothetical protein
MTTQYEDILYEIKEGVATITINRPDKYNAFRAQTCEEMIDAFLKAGWNKKVGVIVLTGAGYQSLLHRRRSVGPRRALRRTRRHRPAAGRIAKRDPRRAQAGHRQGARLRHRRRPRPGAAVRFDAGRRIGQIRPSRPQGRFGRSRFRHRLHGAGDRRKEGAGSLVSVPPVHGGGSGADGLGEQGRARRSNWTPRWIAGARRFWRKARPRWNWPSAPSTPTPPTSPAFPHWASKRSACSTAPRNRRKACGRFRKSASRSLGNEADRAAFLDHLAVSAGA